MEAVGAFLDQDWESLNIMFSTGDYENGFSFGNSSSFWPISDEPSMNFGPFDQSLSELIPHCDAFTDHYFSQESSNSSSNDSFFIPTNPSLENHHYKYDSNNFQETSYALESTYVYAMDNQVENEASLPLSSNNASQETLREKEEGRKNKDLENEDRNGKEELQLKRKNDSHEAPKKRTRALGDAPKGKKNETSRKNQLKLSLNDNSEDNTNGATNGSGRCCSEDSIVSQELNGEETSESKSVSALSSDGKTRAGRGAATDPQSLYARKRRERINERLRILQGLVPNGTKVDISTMLEEAVQYVKFLQLQIKILSSDELWMYAPIAYNGMDMGLYQKIAQ